MTFFIGRIAPIVLASLVLSACAEDGDGDDETGDTGTPTTVTASASASASATATATDTDPSTDSADSSSGGDTVGEVDYVTDIQPIWAANCTTGCHEPGGIYTAFDLTSAASYNTLTMGTPVYGTNPFVDTDAPEESLVVQGLRGTALTLRQMPLLLDTSTDPPTGVAGTPLSEEDIAKVEAWMAAGANP